MCAGLEITLRCNMSCVHCGSDATRNERPDSLTHEDWLKVIDDLKTLGNKSVTLSGGEPFMYPRWRELVQHIAQRKMRANFISNGYFIREDDIVFMKQNRVTHVAVSVDGDEADPRRACDASRAHTPASWKSSPWGRSTSFPITVVTSVNKRNFGVREKIREAMLENGVPQWQVQIVNSFGRAGENSATSSCSIQDRVHRSSATTSSGGGGHTPASSAWIRPIPWGTVTPSPMNSWATANGAAATRECTWWGCRPTAACSAASPSRTRSFIAGNVRERSLVDIWNDDGARSRLHAGTTT